MPTNDPSTLPCNLFSYDASGAPLAQLVAQAGDGIAVSGCGTASSPLKITNTKAADAGGVSIVSGNADIILTGTGSRTDPYKVTHASGKAGTYNGLTFDANGHLTGQVNTSAKGVTGVVGGSGITATTDTSTGIVTISWADPDPGGSGDDGESLLPLTGVGGAYTIYDTRLTFDHGVLQKLEVVGAPGGGGGSTTPVPVSVPNVFSYPFNGGDGGTPKEIGFTSPFDGAFLVTVDGDMGTTGQATIAVDGMAISWNFLSNSRGVMLSPSYYTAGAHSVRVSNVAASGMVLITVTVCAFGSPLSGG